MTQSLAFATFVQQRFSHLVNIWGIFMEEQHEQGGICAIPAGEGKSALFCTEFSEEVGDAPNSVTNSVPIFSQC